MHPFTSRWNHNSELYPLVADLVEGHRVVLDVGCGDGTLAGYLVERGHEVLGVDRDLDVLPADTEGAHFELADAANLPYTHDSFDAVVAVASLHHNRDQGLVLAEMRRVLRPGGRIVVVGLAADRTPQDYARSAADVVRSTWRARGTEAWKPACVEADPALGWDETRTLIGEYLEGATWAREGSFRYVATWDRPA